MPRLSRITAAVGAGAAGAAIAVGALAAGGALDGSDASTASAQTQTATVTTQAPASSSGAASAAGQIDYESLYARVSGSVVEVQARGGQGESAQSDSPFPDPRNDEGVALGTGFVVGADGTIVTNAHVVGTSDSVSVRFGEGDDLIPARVLGRDPSSDVAVLRVDPEAVGTALRPLALANSDEVEVGEPVLAIGNPFGLERTATAGIISATGRQIDAPNGFSIAGALQTDAAINSGNSGGPLLDAEGRVLGINSQILAGGGSADGTSQGGNVGIGFAVSANTVRDVLPQLQRGETIERPYLGISTAAPAEGTDGAVVGEVSANGPGAQGGLRARDLITQIAGQDVAEPDDVAAAIADRSPGDTVEVRVRRDGQERTLRVRLGTRPQEAQ